MLDQGCEIVGVVGRVWPAGNGGRRSEPTMRKRHARIAGREVRDLLPPRHVVAAEPMREQQRRPAARHLVVDRAVQPFQLADAAGGEWRLSAHAGPLASFGSGFLDSSSMASARCSSAML